MSLTRARFLGLTGALIELVGMKNRFSTPYKNSLTLLLSSNICCNAQTDPLEFRFPTGAGVFRSLEHIGAAAKIVMVKSSNTCRTEATRLKQMLPL